MLLQLGTRHHLDSGVLPGIEGQLLVHLLHPDARLEAREHVLDQLAEIHVDLGLVVESQLIAVESVFSVVDGETAHTDHVERNAVGYLQRFALHTLLRGQLLALGNRGHA